METTKKITGKSIMQRVAILFIYCMCACDTMVEVALGDISAAFSDASPVLISLIANIHVFSMVICTVFVVPFLINRVDKKKLVILSMLGYGVFGTLGAVFSPNIVTVLGEQLLFGIGMAFAAPLSMVYVNELYSGTDRENMIGWSQTLSSLVATLMALLAGVLCAIQWRYTFWCFALFIIGVILMIFFRPSSKPNMEVLVDKKSGKRKSLFSLYTKQQKIKLVLIILFMIVLLMGIITFNIKLSIIIEERGLGTAKLAGLAKAMTTVGTLVLSAVFGVLYKLINKYTILLGLIITLVGCFIGAYAQTPFMIVFGTFLGGAGMGISVPAISSKVMQIGCPETASLGVSLLSAFMGCGMFLATFFELIVGIFVPTTTKNILMGDGFMLVGLAVILLIYFIWNPLKGTDWIEMQEKEEASKAE